MAPTARFGLIQWAPHIFDAASFGISSQVEEYVSTLLPRDRYVRIQATLPRNLPLDQNDDSSIQQLRECAAKTVAENKQNIETVAKSCKVKILT